MKKDRTTLKLTVFLLSTSFLLYLINFIIFKDIHHIIEFIAQYVAFIPIEAIVTVVIIGRILENRDKKKRKQKINILIQVFFEEVGNELLCRLTSKDKKCCEIGCLRSEFDELFASDLKKAKKIVDNYKGDLDLKAENINSLYELLHKNKETFIKFLENPYLTEHDTFTDLMQSISHLYYEIRFRLNGKSLNEVDIIHLNEDAQRVYKHLLEKWLVYMDYIQKEYPFLLNLAVESAPFKNIKN